jgi:hypothetical protein
MHKVNGWLFLLIGILMLLPLIGVDVGTVGSWLIMLAFVVIGVLKITAK